MIRTQIQLEDRQMAALKELAAILNVSVAELVRRAVDLLVANQHGPSPNEQRTRALAALGQFSSGHADIAEEHDRYLSEAYES